MPESTTTAIQGCLDRLKAGDQTARDELIQRAATRTEQLTRQMLASFPRLHEFEDTSDVHQQAMIRTLRALEAVPVNSPADFLRLTATQIRHELINLSKLYFDPQAVANDDRPMPAQGDFHSTVDTPVAAQPAKDQRRLASWTEFHEHVEKLPPDEQCVFDLLWYHKLSCREAGDALGVSESTIKRRWAAARLRLCDAFAHGVPEF